MFDQQVTQLSEASGVGESGLRLLLSVLVGNVFGIVYRGLIGIPTSFKHWYSFAGGLFLAVFCYAEEAGHSLACILGTYIILAVVGSTSRWAALVLSYIFNFGYLLGGYYFMATDGYDIDWTMAHCVLTLRLIGFTFDFYDGASDDLSRHRDRQKNHLKELPPLIEVLGYAYHFGGFLVGPQFSFRFYESFIGRSAIRTGGVGIAVLKFVLGLAYMALSQTVGATYTTAHVLTEEFAAYETWQKVVAIMVCGKLTYCKYIAMWLLVESGCILSGLGYNGDDDKGTATWDAISNADVWKFETTPYLYGIVESFNINTNNWAKAYTFKRLAFLGNKELSKLGALTFLAIWHGWSPGYFLAFYFEFLSMGAEQALLMHFPKVLPGFVTYPIGWFLRTFVIAYAILPFDLLTWEKSYRAWDTLHFVPIYVCLVLFVLALVLPKPKRTPPKESDAKTSAPEPKTKKI